MLLLLTTACILDYATYQARLAELTDNDGDGASEVDGDCDDNDAAVSPEAAELCNEIDDDCDGGVDETDDLVGAEWYPDSDTDGSGSGTPVITCEPPGGMVQRGEDCDDTDAAVYPGAPERCNGADDDCDEHVDEVEEVATLDWYPDLDQDGWGAGEAIASCAAPELASIASGDCDDGDAAVHPEATETCNGADDDCNGAVDDAPAITWYLDRDEDGYGDESAFYVVCAPPPGYVRDAGDCDDEDPERNPGAWDECEDGLDADCDGREETCGIPAGEADVDDVSARFTGAAGEAYVARSVAAAGDLDGDGDDELLVTRGEWGDYTGKVHIIPGDAELYLGETSLDSVGAVIEGTDASGAFGFTLGTGADVDGDGTTDVAISTYGPDVVALFRGGSSLLASDHDRDDAWATYRSEAGTGTFGISVAVVGDIDGDGFGEVLIGDNWINDQGAAWLFYGEGVGGEYDTETDGVSLSGSEPEEQAGQHVCGPGDFNGDGLPELVVANNIGDGGDAVRGGGFMFMGSRARLESQALSDADVVYEGTPTAGLFGACAGVGDVDDDGRADLAFSGTRYESGRGAVHVLMSDPVPAGGPIYDVAEVEWLGEVGRVLGASVAGAGDLDGDGHVDLAATSTRNDGTAFAAVLPGAAGLNGAFDLDDAMLLLVGGNTELEGDGLSSPLDLNGDGAADFVVSAWSGSQGEAWLVYGAP